VEEEMKGSAVRFIVDVDIALAYSIRASAVSSSVYSSATVLVAVVAVAAVVVASARW
jgi:hypothetical protein